MDSELWRPVAGYEDFYEVSDYGRVRGLDRTDSKGRRYRGRILKPSLRLYPLVVLCRDGKHVSSYVHVLVLETFVGSRPAGMEACHFPDRDPANVRLDNLRWDTSRSNARDMQRHGTTARGLRHGMAKFQATDIERVFDLRVFGFTHKCIALWLGMSRQHVGKLLSGQRRSGEGRVELKRCEGE